MWSTYQTCKRSGAHHLLFLKKIAAAVIFVQEEASTTQADPVEDNVKLLNKK